MEVLVNVVMQFCTHTSAVELQVAMAFISFTPIAASEQFFVQACINVRAPPPDPPVPEAPPADDPLAPPVPEIPPADDPLAPPVAEPPVPEAPPAGLVPPVAEAPPPPVGEALLPPVAEVPPVAGGLAAGLPLLLQAQTQAATPNTETADPTLYFNMSFLIFCPITAFAAKRLCSESA